MKRNGMEHTRCSPCHPFLNRAAEHLVCTFKDAMKAGDKDGHTPQHQLDNFLLTYRTTPHSTTRATPCSLFSGRNIQTQFDLLKPSVTQNVHDKQTSQKQYHNQRAHQREFKIGDYVVVRNFRAGPTYIPGTITAILGPITYIFYVLKMKNYEASHRPFGKFRNSKRV